MTAPPSETSVVGPQKWQYSLKTLMIVTTGVCIWAKIAALLWGQCAGPLWFKGVFVVALGALLAQGALYVWAWRQLHRQENPAAENSYGRLRVSIAWGIVPLALWLTLCLAAFRPTWDGGLITFVGAVILHIALPTVLLLTASTLRGKDVFPVRVTRWAVVASCLVPLAGVAIAVAM